MISDELCYFITLVNIFLIILFFLGVGTTEDKEQEKDSTPKLKDILKDISNNHDVCYRIKEIIIDSDFVNLLRDVEGVSIKHFYNSHNLTCLNSRIEFSYQDHDMIAKYTHHFSPTIYYVKSEKEIEADKRKCKIQHEKELIKIQQKYL